MYIKEITKNYLSKYLALLTRYLPSQSEEEKERLWHLPVNSSEMVESALFCHSLGLPASSDKIKEKGSEILNCVLNNFLKHWLVENKQTNKQKRYMQLFVENVT